MDAMPTAASTLEHGYFLAFPKIICEKTDIKAGDRFYAYRTENRALTLSRHRTNKSQYSVPVDFHSEHGAILPYGFLHRMGIRVGDEVVLTAAEDKITIRKSSIIPLFPIDSDRGRLERKLILELQAPSKGFSQGFRKDIYSVLTRTEWQDDTIRRLLQTPKLLQKIARALHKDDLLSASFRQRTINLTLELAAQDVI